MTIPVSMNIHMQARALLPEVFSSSMRLLRVISEREAAF